MKKSTMYKIGGAGIAASLLVGGYVGQDPFAFIVLDKKSERDGIEASVADADNFIKRYHQMGTVGKVLYRPKFDGTIIYREYAKRKQADS